MSANDNTRYYWFKLQKNYFDRHDIKILESLPNGKDYSLLLLKLLCESTSHEGKLRFSELIPYNKEMISSITNTNIDTVTAAFQIYKDLGLVEIWDDGTIFMTMIHGMIGSETGSAKRKRVQRSDIEGTNGGQCLLDIRDKSKSIDIKKNNKKKNFVPPTVEEIAEYCNERQNGIDPERFWAYYESVGWTVKGKPMKSWKAAVITWEKNNKESKGAFDDNNKFVYL